MSRIKKSIARSNSKRKFDLSQAADSPKGQNLRETPYANPQPLGQISKFHQDSQNLQNPEAYRSKVKNKQNLSLLRSKVFEKDNRRYEMDTADTESSWGYKFLKKSPSGGQGNGWRKEGHSGKGGRGYDWCRVFGSEAEFIKIYKEEM